MAYAGGYAGGYADTIIPTAGTGTGYKVQHPIYSQPVRTVGRAKKRFRVTILTWGAEAHNSTSLMVAAAGATSGTGKARAETLIDGDMRLRHGHARTRSRAELGTHIGDPREDDQRIALMIAALQEQQEP